MRSVTVDIKMIFIYDNSLWKIDGGYLLELPQHDNP